jgi:hypothetical protein
VKARVCLCGNLSTLVYQDSGLSKSLQPRVFQGFKHEVALAFRDIVVQNYAHRMQGQDYVKTGPAFRQASVLTFYLYASPLQYLHTPSFSTLNLFHLLFLELIHIFHEHIFVLFKPLVVVYTIQQSSPHYNIYLRYSDSVLQRGSHPCKDREQNESH